MGGLVDGHVTDRRKSAPDIGDSRPSTFHFSRLGLRPPLTASSVGGQRAGMRWGAAYQPVLEGSFPFFIARRRQP